MKWGPALVKAVLLLALFFLPLAQARPVRAASDHILHELAIEVLLQEDGSARITEWRRATLNKDTELFIVIGNLGKSTIRDFTVEENGRLYNYQEDWDIKASRQEKAFKNGIVPKSDHYELCWGIGEYGRHNYKVSYTITDFVKQLDDAQIIFWRFVNDQTNLPPQQVKLRIFSAGQALDINEEEIWAFGFTGAIAYQDGEIMASSAAALDQDDYVTILARLPQAGFVTRDRLDLSFAQIKDQALKGSSYGKKTKKASSTGDNLISLAAFLLVFTLPALVAVKLALERRRLKRLRLQYAGHYWHDLPFAGDMEEIYALLKQDHQADFERLLAAFLLKWLQSGVISLTVQQTERAWSRKNTLLRLNPAYQARTALEARLYATFQEACGDSLETSQADLARLLQKKSGLIKSWPQETEEASRQFLYENGYTMDTGKKLNLTGAGLELNGRIFMFSNYLRDFSSQAGQADYAQDTLDELMLWAVLLGFGDTFSRHYQSLFPAYFAKNHYTGERFNQIRHISRNFTSSSGSSSSSGGGGSFGGGSGGGSR